MSHSRSNTSRQDDLTRKQYENLRKTTAFDPVEEFQPVTGFRVGSGTGWVSTFLVLNVLFAAGREAFADAASTNANSDIRQLAAAKLKKDPTLPAATARHIKCDHIPNQIASLAEKNSFAADIIRKLLSSSELKIFCSDTKTIAKKVAGGAYFNPNANSITLDAEVSDESNTLHEFTHAHFFFQQKSNPTSPVLLTSGMMVSPLLKVTAAEAMSYMGLLDKGYQRVLEFDKLLELKRNHKDMTKKQKARLNQFLDATKNCLTTINRSTISFNELEQIGMQGYLNGRILANDDGTTIKIIKHIENKNDVTIFAAVQEPHYSLITLVKHVNEMRKNGKFADVYIEAAEYDAYVFMTLDEKAAKVFFHEAKEKRETMIKACDDEREMRRGREL